MPSRIVQRNPLVVMRPRFRNVARKHQRLTRDAMCDQKRSRRSLLLGQGQELCRELANDFPIERHDVRDPEAVEDQEQQQWVFGRLAERVGLFDQQTCFFHRRLGFRRSMSFDMDEWGYEVGMKLDL